MDIIISRHAKRRMKLYGIDDSIIIDIVRNLKLMPGKQVVIQDVTGIEYPLKMVLDMEPSQVVIITAYPLKRQVNDENTV